MSEGMFSNKVIEACRLLMNAIEFEKARRGTKRYSNFQKARPLSKKQILSRLKFRKTRI